ncbi:MAG: PEP/pyruvate-binding domain-containing protein [Gammaproteobacteria bacterium]
MSLVIGLDDPRATHCALVGGKACSLGRLAALGFHVPPGFTVSTHAHDEFLAADGLHTRLRAQLGELDTNDALALERQTAAIRALIEAQPLPPTIVAAIATAYAALGDEVYVAVRSSSTAEDPAVASFAGMYDTHLDVYGREAVLAAVRRCWASMWTARVITYRHQMGFDGDVERLAVMVQTMLEPTAAGVMFTANPMSAGTDEIVLNASWGRREAVISGIVKPDSWVLARDSLTIKSRELGRKDKKIVRNLHAGHGALELSTTPEERALPSLNEAQARQLAAIGRDIMQRYGGQPQDIEWARVGESFFVLRVRPMTGVEFTWDEDVDGWQDARDAADTTWTYTRSMDSTGGISPLFYSCRAFECYLNYARFARLFGLKGITKVRWHKYRRATAYFNADAERAWLTQQWPAQLRDLTNIPPAWHQDYLATPVSKWSLLRMWARVHLLEPEFGVTRWFATTYDYLDHRTAEADGPSAAALAALDDTALIAAAEARVALVDGWYRTLWPPFFLYATGALAGLAKILEHWYADNTPSTFQDLLCGTPGNQVALEAEAMFELAERIRHSAELNRLFVTAHKASFFDTVRSSDHPDAQAFTVAYGRFIEQHGHRGHQDCDFYYERRAENPSLDYEALRHLLDSDDPVHPEVLMDKLVKRRRAVTAAVCAHLRKQRWGALRERLFRYVANYCLRFRKFRDDERHYRDRLTYGKKRVFLEIGKRLQARGLLDAPEDFWFLARFELYGYLLGQEPAALCKAKMAARKRVFQRRNARLEPTPTWIRNDVPVDLSGAAQELLAVPPGTLAGFATKRGLAADIARIVPKLDQIRQVERSDILICDTTEPS